MFSKNNLHQNKSTFRRLPLSICFLLTLLIGGTTVAFSGVAPKDGGLSFPEYQGWPVFLKGIEKPNMIRDLYVNPAGSKTQKGEAFPEGTTLVMEIYDIKKSEDGKAEKDKLSKVFVMQKGKGWGAHAPKGLENGDWVYTAFSADGKVMETDYAKCRGCHLPLGEEKDFVHRYDEYFDKRGH